jgi:hypothetical protein
MTQQRLIPAKAVNGFVDTVCAIGVTAAFRIVRDSQLIQNYSEAGRFISESTQCTHPCVSGPTQAHGAQMPQNRWMLGSYARRQQ